MLQRLGDGVTPVSHSSLKITSCASAIFLDEEEKTKEKVEQTGSNFRHMRSCYC
jgi:hypothetical protein